MRIPDEATVEPWAENAEQARLNKAYVEGWNACREEMLESMRQHGGMVIMLSSEDAKKFTAIKKD